MKNILVACFSASGVTEQVARAVAQACDADFFEILPAVPYTEADLNWRDSSSRSTLEMQDPSSRPAIAGSCADMDRYDTVLVGFPIWWYVAPTVINTFLESYDLSGKTVIPFATSGGSSMGKTNEKLAPSCPGARLMPGKLLNGASQESIVRWLKEVGVLS